MLRWDVSSSLRLKTCFWSGAIVFEYLSGQRRSDIREKLGHLKPFQESQLLEACPLCYTWRESYHPTSGAPSYLMVSVHLISPLANRIERVKGQMSEGRKGRKMVEDLSNVFCCQIYFEILIEKDETGVSGQQKISIYDGKVKRSPMFLNVSSKVRGNPLKTSHFKPQNVNKIVKLEEKDTQSGEHEFRS